MHLQIFLKPQFLISFINGIVIIIILTTETLQGFSAAGIVIIG
jgi:hypothetical protein